MSLLKLYNKRIEIAFKNLYKKFAKAKNATDIYRAITEVDKENLRDNERYLILQFLKTEFPEAFEIKIQKIDIFDLDIIKDSIKKILLKSKEI